MSIPFNSKIVNIAALLTHHDLLRWPYTYPRVLDSVWVLHLFVVAYVKKMWQLVLLSFLKPEFANRSLCALLWLSTHIYTYVVTQPNTLSSTPTLSYKNTNLNPFSLNYFYISLSISSLGWGSKFQFSLSEVMHLLTRYTCKKVQDNWTGETR